MQVPNKAGAGGDPLRSTIRAKGEKRRACRKATIRQHSGILEA